MRCRSEFVKYRIEWIVALAFAVIGVLLRDFIEERMKGNLASFVEKRTKGHGGYIQAGSAKRYNG